MTLIPFLLACVSGTADFTITDLEDPSGRLEEAWSANSAYWNYTDSVEGIEFWTLSADTNTLTFVGDNYFVDNLLLTSTDGSCEDLQDWLDVGTDVVAGIEDGAPAAESCEALTAYFDHVESLDSGAERLVLTAGSYDLAVGNPDTGTWDGWASLFWRDGDEGEAERWDAENCIYTYAPFDVESTEWDIDDVEITIDRTIAGVTGSLTGTLNSESNSSGTLSVDFSAESCEYTGGAGLLLTP